MSAVVLGPRPVLSIPRAERGLGARLRLDVGALKGQRLLQLAVAEEHAGRQIIPETRIDAVVFSPRRSPLSSHHP